MSTETIPFRITLGLPGDGELNLRFPPEYRSDIQNLLDEAGLDHGTSAEFSAGVDLAIEAVKVIGVSGGMAAFASVIKTFVTRNAGKKVVLRDGTEIQGFSKKQIMKILETLAAEQEKVDADWKRIAELPGQEKTD